MRFWTAALATALVMGGTVNAGVPSDLEGKWFVVQRVYTPSNANAEAAQAFLNLGNKVEFKGSKLVSLATSKVPPYLTVKASGSGSPANINFTVPTTRQTLKGIYRIEGNVLSIAVDAIGGRPSTFTGSDKQLLLILTPLPK